MLLGCILKLYVTISLKKNQLYWVVKNEDGLSYFSIGKGDPSLRFGSFIDI